MIIPPSPKVTKIKNYVMKNNISSFASRAYIGTTFMNDILPKTIKI